MQKLYGKAYIYGDYLYAWLRARLGGIKY